METSEVISFDYTNNAFDDSEIIFKKVTIVKGWVNESECKQIMFRISSEKLSFLLYKQFVKIS